MCVVYIYTQYLRSKPAVWRRCVHITFFINCTLKTGSLLLPHKHRQQAQTHWNGFPAANKRQFFAVCMTTGCDTNTTCRFCIVCAPRSSLALVVSRIVSLPLWHQVLANSPIRSKRHHGRGLFHRHPCRKLLYLVWHVSCHGAGVSQRAHCHWTQAARWYEYLDQEYIHQLQ